MKYLYPALPVAYAAPNGCSDALYGTCRVVFRCHAHSGWGSTWRHTYWPSTRVTKFWQSPLIANSIPIARGHEGHERTNWLRTLSGAPPPPQRARRGHINDNSSCSRGVCVGGERRGTLPPPAGLTVKAVSPAGPRADVQGAADTVRSSSGPMRVSTPKGAPGTAGAVRHCDRSAVPIGARHKP